MQFVKVGYAGSNFPEHGEPPAANAWTRPIADPAMVDVRWI